MINKKTITMAALFLSLTSGQILPNEPSNALEFRDPKYDPSFSSLKPTDDPADGLFHVEGMDTDPYFANQIDLMEFTSRLDWVCAPLGNSLICINGIR